MTAMRPPQVTQRRAKQLCTGQHADRRAPQAIAVFVSRDFIPRAAQGGFRASLRRARDQHRGSLRPSGCSRNGPGRNLRHRDLRAIGLGGAVNAGSRCNRRAGLAGPEVMGERELGSAQHKAMAKRRKFLMNL